jgi:hypothetical protein
MPVFTVILTASYAEKSDPKIMEADLTRHACLACAFDTKLIHGLRSRDHLK